MPNFLSQCSFAKLAVSEAAKQLYRQLCQI